MSPSAPAGYITIPNRPDTISPMDSMDDQTCKPFSPGRISLNISEGVIRSNTACTKRTLPCCHDRAFHGQAPKDPLMNDLKLVFPKRFRDPDIGILRSLGSICGRSYRRYKECLPLSRPGRAEPRRSLFTRDRFDSHAFGHILFLFEHVTLILSVCLITISSFI